MKIIQLNSGEIVSAEIIEVTGIPSIDNINGASSEIILERYRSDMVSLLSEFHNIALSNYSSHAQKTELSIELIWASERVEAQTYEAKIRFFIVVRGLGHESSRAATDRISTIITNRLALLQYRTAKVDYDNLLSSFKSFSIEKTEALIKRERIENLGNQILPACYAFDRFDSKTNDLAVLLDAMSHDSDALISFSLIPTRYRGIEEATIQQFTQSLESLRKGVFIGAPGNVSVSAAEEYADLYTYYNNNKNSALFESTITVAGKEKAVDNIMSALNGMLIHSDGRQMNLRAVSLDNKVQMLEQFHALPWIVNNETPHSTNSAFKSLQRVPHIITAEEASLFFRLPIGSKDVSAGITINETAQISKTYSSEIVNSGDITIGTLKSTGNSDSIGIHLQDLAKHMLIVGTPGSGKTTFSIGLLDRLWKEHQIPFLVIEPAKNEYRALIKSIPELQVFTPGKNLISPFIFNPFVPPKNVKLETYKSTLKTAFAAGVSMTSPLDRIFEDTINNCYADHRWLDTYTSDGMGEVFNISDFIKCFQETFDEIGYTGDAKNIGRAGTVRLKGLVNLFDNYYSIPVEDLMRRPTVIELAAIENAEQKSLIIALLLLSIMAYVNANYVGEGGLKNFILLEEAHVLLDNKSNNNSDSNPEEIAQSLIKRMLAEIRSYGVGIGVADQSPRKVTSDVVALTDMKVVFRLVEATDKQIISDSMNLEDNQITRLGRLRPGEAFFFFNRLDEPEEINTPNYRFENNISISLSDEGISQQVQYWKGKEQCLRPYPECSIINSCQTNCDYEVRLLGRELARRIFKKQFNSSDNTLDPVVKTFGRISLLINSELNDEELTPRLKSCVKCHLWRKIALETQIPVKKIQIENSLRKE